MWNGPKQLYKTDLAKWWPCRSKISDFLEAIASKSSNKNKNCWIIIERVTSNMSPSLFKLI